MGCACNRNRKARAAGVTYKFQVTPPVGPVEEYMTAREAKSAVRRHGGGDIRRVTVSAQPTTTVRK